MPVCDTDRSRLRLVQAAFRAPLAVWVYVLAVVGAGAGLWLAVLAAGQEPRDDSVTISLPLLVLGFALAESWTVGLRFTRQNHSLSLSEIPLVFGLLFVEPGDVLIAYFAGGVVALALRRRQFGIRLLFNAAQFVLTAGLALVTFRLLAGPELSAPREWLALLAAGMTFSVVGNVVVAGVVRVAEGRSAMHESLATLGFGAVGASAAISLAAAAAELARSRPAGLLLLGVPVAALAIAFRGYVAERREREKIGFLYESMRSAQSAPEFEEAVARLLHQARELFGVRYCEIGLLPLDSDSGALVSTSSPGGDLLMQPATVSELDRVLVAAAEGGVTVAVREGGARSPLADALTERDLTAALVCLLRTEARTLGWFVVGDRTAGSTEFAQHEVALFETFASHAAVIIENGRLERSLARVIELKDELRHQAFHDVLTGLPNRVLFADEVSAALAASSSSPAAVLFLDLDDFKAVNDTWGHATGDSLLVAAADRLRHAIRPDDIPCRLGGDEFAVLLADVDEETAGRVAFRLEAAFAPPFVVGGRSIVSRPSIGIAMSEPELAADDLIARADVAMYTAKHAAQRRPVAYRSEEHDVWRRRRALAFDLDRALEAGEVDVYFQPAISFADGSIRAVEALVRWLHPDSGVVPPGEFLPFADPRQLNAIGEIVLTKAAGRVRSWQELAPGGRLDLWVNLSAEELASDDLVARVVRVLEATGLAPELLTLEVTESSVVEDAFAGIKLMRELHELGITFSIDDFGTGYSSLARLGEFPLDILKIPKPFVDRLRAGETSASLVEGILRLAETFGLTTVAEGVEHRIQAKLLHALGADLAQGYLYSRPLPAAELEELLLAPHRLTDVA
ncbi:MAG: EAL domain-containing protein [Gaiellales bacterium]